MDQDVKYMLRKDTLMNELTKTIDEIYSHHVRAIDIHVTGEITSVPTMSVSYEYYILSKNTEGREND